jgi:hypothetical protein
MHTQTHVLTGWCLSNCLNLTPRERLFAVVAATVADLDGLSRLGGQEAYWTYHHLLGHNATVGVLSAAALALFSRPKLRGFGVYLGLFHVHLVMDYFGSGIGWGFYYGWPFTGWPIENPDAWEFYSWQNLSLGFLSIAWTVAIAARWGRTPLELLMPSLDRQLVALSRRGVDSCRFWGRPVAES